MNDLPPLPPRPRALPLLRALLALSVLLLVLVTSALAFAQTSPPSSGTASAMPTLTLAIALSFSLSVLLGAINQAIQGEILGQWATPKAWLPVLTIAGSFIAGVVGYLQSLPAGWTLTGAVAFFAIAAGLVHLEAANAAARAVDSHVTKPAAMRAMRKAMLASKVDPVTKAAAALSSVFLLALLLGCQNPAGTVTKVAPPATATVECVVGDAIKGDTLSQIVDDCGGDVAQVVAILVDPATYQKVAPSPAYAEAGRVKLALARTP